MILSEKKSVLVVALSTRAAKDAAGERTSALMHALRDEHCTLSLFCVSPVRDDETQLLSAWKISLLGKLYANSKSRLLSRVLIEGLLFVEFLLRGLPLLLRAKTVYVSSPPFFFAMGVALLSLLTRRKTIFDAKDLYPQSFVMANVVSKENAVYRLVLSTSNAIFKRCVLVVATKGMQAFYQECFPKKTIHLLLNGSSLIGELHNKTRSKQFRVIFHGRLGKFQHVELVKAVVDSCPLVNFSFYSDDASALGPILHYANVQVFRSVPLKELKSEIEASHLGISFRDNSFLSRISNAVKIFDYVACGTPALVVPKTELDEHLRDTGLFKSVDPDQEGVVDILKNISTDESKYYDMFPRAGTPTSKFNRTAITETFLHNDTLRRELEWR